MDHDCFPSVEMVGVEEIRPMNILTEILLIYIDIGGVSCSLSVTVSLL